MKKIGGFIRSGANTVSAPFHPFGGAVDIIVVAQQDGTFKSSPWYVRFGKFQGVLKLKEKLVSINVNGVDADFNMYLDHKGEAYFIREVEVSEADSLFSPSSSGEDTDVQLQNRRPPMKTQSLNFDSVNSVTQNGLTNGSVLTRTNSKRSRILKYVFGRRSIKENVSGVVRTESLERAELAADLLEMKWSTNLISDMRKNNDKLLKEELVKDLKTQKEACSISFQKLESSVSENSCVVSEYLVETSLKTENSDSLEQGFIEEVSVEKNEFHERIISSDKDFLNGKSALLNILGSEISAEEQLLFGDLEEVKNLQLEEVKNLQLEEVNNLQLEEVKNLQLEEIKNLQLEEVKNLQIVSQIIDSPRENEGNESSDIHIDKNNTRRVKSLPNISSLNNSISNNQDSKKILFQPDSIRRVKSLRNQEDEQINPPINNNLSESIDVPEEAANSNTEDLVKNGSEKEGFEIKLKKIITLCPTSEQIASLNLKEGKNIITFTFSTSMLGKQQVDARIYLWRWDTRIVISDVDGTITRSDVLGQFMPFVGVDWSHSGVAHLFSAIKENGYQVIFLSARAVSQAYQTRQFLLNLKQDGKTLPDGPVVISPDGLFPSLFREVVRRAPHEFKIACLEEIKALFPSDRNPFYAGFGNRETDEFSYLKVGIPIGKIFIINPKGEIVVNRQVDTKSYTSIHALVNRMFPPATLFEEETFNSYNFWKLPPPTI